MIGFTLSQASYHYLRRRTDIAVVKARHVHHIRVIKQAHSPHDTGVCTFAALHIRHCVHTHHSLAAFAWLPFDGEIITIYIFCLHTLSRCHNAVRTSP